MYDEDYGRDYNPITAEDKLLVYRLIRYRVDEVGHGEVIDSDATDSSTSMTWRIEVPLADDQRWNASGALSADLVVSDDKANPLGVEARYTVWLQLSTGGISEEPYSVAVVAESPIPYLNTGVAGIVGFLTEHTEEFGEDIRFEPDLAVARRQGYGVG